MRASHESAERDAWVTTRLPLDPPPTRRRRIGVFGVLRNITVVIAVIVCAKYALPYVSQLVK